ncbi:MAG: chlorite dismutase family protein [Caldilineaceae bacterium]|nr:chlorite dismutase family protein [Caldilineaceae bacterium]
MTQETPILDLSEKGRGGIKLDRRLYMQFLAFGDCLDVAPVFERLAQAGIDAAVYADVNDPRGIGLLTMSEDADFFVTDLRRLLTDEPFIHLTPKPEYTMFGRTYSIGYEADLERTLIGRPRERALDPNWPWVIWYPLRRVKTFELLPKEEKGRILGEHGNIGQEFGKADLATDIRLSCHGLDKNDNDFVIAVLAHQLHAASAVVERMRSTQQTTKWLQSLGPFFVGRVIWQAKK